MLEIIKYQLKGRRNAMALILAIFGILNVVAFGVEISGVVTDYEHMDSALGFWIVVAILTTSIVTTVMFFLCSTGHVNELLYKDSSYLMLTVPRHGWEILGGRFIAGLVEFLAYGLAAGFLASIHFAIAAPFITQERISSLRLFAFLYEQVFVVNFLSSAQIALIGLCVFTILGVFITFAVVASRSFVKNRGIGIAVAIAVFVAVTSQASRWGTMLSEKLNWYWNIKIVTSLQDSGFPDLPNVHFTLGSAQTIPVPAAPFLFFLVLAALLFAASSWLMERKVEL